MTPKWIQIRPCDPQKDPQWGARGTWTDEEWKAWEASMGADDARNSFSGRQDYGGYHTRDKRDGRGSASSQEPPARGRSGGPWSGGQPRSGARMNHDTWCYTKYGNQVGGYLGLNEIRSNSGADYADEPGGAPDEDEVSRTGYGPDGRLINDPMRGTLAAGASRCVVC